MAKAKNKVELKDLGKKHIKDALLRVHPFLRTFYRVLKKDELESEEVFKELFPNELKFESYKLAAIYALQN